MHRGPYVSWAYAWAEVKKLYPSASYEVKKFNGLPYVYDPITGFMVYTSVTIEGVSHEMWLPVLDGANKAMKATPYTYTTPKWDYNPQTRRREKIGMEERTVEAASMFDLNKAIMRCLVKNLAMFGLGLYVYAGEDLPEDAANKEAGIKILIPNGEFYASKVCDTFEEAIDLDVEALEKQLVKYKEKQRSK